MFRLRTIVAVSLVALFAHAAQAQFGGDAVKGKPRAGGGQRSGNGGRGIAWGGPNMLKGVAGRKPQTPPTNAKASRSNGPTIVPTSNSAGLKAGSGALEGDPDQPLGAFTDDNGAPSEVGLSVKSRAGGDKIRPRHRGIHPGSSMYDWR